MTRDKALLLQDDSSMDRTDELSMDRAHQQLRNEGSSDKHGKEEDDPRETFLKGLLDDPLKFASNHMLQMESVESSEGDTTTTASMRTASRQDDKSGDDGHDHHHHHHDMNHNSFCNPMMMMDEHSRRLHGVGEMPMGGDMSKGMVMYMDGFRFAMTGNQPCLNLYFPSWTLDTRWKFIGSLLLVFLISFGTEGVSKYRHKLSSRLGGTGRQSRRTRQIIISLLHGVQALLGYIVMLATMTFSLEILMTVVVGLSSGYYYFFAGEVGLEGHVTTNPCCNFMQDESNEHEQAQFQQQQQQQSANAGDEMTEGLLSLSQSALAGTHV